MKARSTKNRNLKWQNVNLGDGRQRKETDTDELGRNFLIVESAQKFTPDTGFVLFLVDQNGILHEIADKGTMNQAQAFAEVFNG
jgi:hypothetical protein